MKRSVISWCQATTWPMNHGPVQEQEMFRVFNMGIGYVLIVDQGSAADITAKLTDLGESVYQIGTITKGTGKVTM